MSSGSSGIDRILPAESTEKSTSRPCSWALALATISATLIGMPGGRPQRMSTAE
jgi:hypothetical protein